MEATFSTMAKYDNEIGLNFMFTTINQDVWLGTFPVPQDKCFHANFNPYLILEGNSSHNSTMHLRFSFYTRLFWNSVSPSL